MPLIFSRSLIKSAGAVAAAETVVTINGRSYSSSYSPLYANSYTIVKDELGICGTPTGASQFKYLPLSDGTYNFKLTAIGGSWNRVNYFYTGIGWVRDVGGSAVIAFTYNANWGGDGGTPSTMSEPSLPYDLGNRTISSSTDGRGLFAWASNVYGGFSSSMGSTTWTITAV